MRSEPRSRSYALLGGGALALQVVFVREFLAIFHSSELFAGAVLGVWLVWVGLGSALGALIARKLDPSRSLAALYALLGLLSAGAVPAARLLPAAAGLPPGFLPSMPIAIGLAAAAMLLPCVLIGASFPLTAGVRRDAGRLYVWDSAGGLVGGLLVAAAVSWLAPDAMTLSAACALAFGLLSVGWAGACSGAAWRAPGIAVLCLGVLLLAVPGARRRVEGGTLAWLYPGETIVQWKEATDGRWITTRTADGPLNLYVGGALQWSQVDETAVDEFAALAVLAHPGPRRIAALSHPADPLPSALALACPQARVEAVVPYVGGPMDGFASGAGVAAGGGVEYVGKDARAYLRSLEGEKDLIVCQPGLPESFLSSRLVTRESFAEVRRALRPGGLLAVRLPFSTSYQNEGVRKVLASIVTPAGSEFRHVRLEPLPYAGVILLASGEPLAGLQEIGNRYAGRGAGLRHFRPELLGSGEERNFRLGELRAAVQGTPASPNTDMLPSAIRYQERVTRTMYGREGWTSGLEPGTAWPGLVFVAVVASLCLAGARSGGGRWRLEGMALAFAAGAAGMVVEVALLCSYQVRCGALYREVSLLLALVLAGTAAGAHISGRRSREFASAPLGRKALWCAVCLMPAAVFAGSLFAAPWMLSRPVTWLLALTSGAAVGAAYPAALALGRPATADDDAAGGARGGYVLAADLAGAAAGSILGGGVFIPVLGLKGVALAALVLGLVAALTAVTARR